MVFILGNLAPVDVDSFYDYLLTRDLILLGNLLQILNLIVSAISGGGFPY